MKRFLLIFFIASLTFSVCAQEPAPLILGGKHYEGRVGERVVIDFLTGQSFSDSPRKCYVEDAKLISLAQFDVDPLNPEKMNGLENVELLTNINYVSITGENLHMVDFSPLSSLNNLEILIINGNISRLPNLASLQKLRVFNIENSALESLDGLEGANLKRLRITGENLHMIDFSPLVSLSNLESLTIIGNISRLPDLTSLQELSVIGIKKSALKTLEGLGAPKLRWLEINMETFDSLAPLSNLPELKRLDISIRGRNNFVSIGEIKDVPKLEIIFLYSNGIVDFTGIERLTSLKDLRIDSKITVLNPQGISSLNNLELLLIDGIENETPSLEFLRGLSNLRILSIRGKAAYINSEIETPYQVLDVSPLAECHNLENINLKGLIIKNISALNNLENLAYNAVLLDGSRLFDETEESTHWLIFDTFVLRDG